MRNIMSFQDFIASATARWSRCLQGVWGAHFSEALPSLERSQIFFLGDDVECNGPILDIAEDLHEDMRERLRCPFRDLSIVTAIPDTPVGGGRFQSYSDEYTPSGVDYRGWILERVVESPVGLGRTEDGNLDLDALGLPLKDRGIVQRFLFMRIEVNAASSEEIPPVAWGVGYRGISSVAAPIRTNEVRIIVEGQKTNVQLFPGYVFVEDVENSIVAIPMGSEEYKDDDRTRQTCGDSALAFNQIAAISHPGHYVVSTEPTLTPKETRRVANGKRGTPGKRQYFILVDHDQLVDLSRDPSKSTGTHASPVPHHRRGHWMRLAERCVSARAAGLHKTWVRPAYVGKTEFEDKGNRYRVMMDFGQPERK